MLVILLEVAVGIFYGFYAFNVTGENSLTNSLEFILTNALAVLGFGLLLVHQRHSVRQMLFSTIFVASINMQLGPLLQKFWYDVFIHGFHWKNDDLRSSTFIAESGGSQIDMNLGFLRVSTLCTIGLLAALSGVTGRMGVISLFISTTIFNFGFNLSYYLNCMIAHKYPGDLIFDDFNGSRVFSFAAGFGLALTSIYHCAKPVLREQNQKAVDSSMFSGILTLLGTGFTFCLFYYIIDPHSKSNKFLGMFNVLIALCGTVLTGMAMSSLIKGKISFLGVNFGILSGVIMLAIIGNFIFNPFVAMIVGVSGGVLSGLGLYIHDKRNSKKITDTKGFFPVIFLSCIFGSYMVVPIILKAYENSHRNLDFNEGRHMVYTSISIGIGFFFGILASLFKFCLGEKPLMRDYTFFSESFNINKQPAIKPSISTNKRVSQEMVLKDKDTKGGTHGK